MKTEQEQIEKIARTMCGYCSTDGKCAVSKNGRAPDICANVDDQNCLYKEYADRLIENGFGDISEYKAEIERLKAENEQSRKLGILGNNVTVEFHDDVVSEQSEQSVDYNDIEKYAKQFRNRIIYLNEKEIKQAQINVLNKAKERAVRLSAIETYHICNLIDELIKEVEESE